MHLRRGWLVVCALVAGALLAGCGGGGGGDSASGDISTGVPRAPAAATWLDRFLLYPNPLVAADGSFEVAQAQYANAYYEAIDPTQAKDTLAKWKLAIVLEQGFQRAGDDEKLLAFGPVVTDLMASAAELAESSDYR